VAYFYVVLCVQVVIKNDLRKDFNSLSAAEFTLTDYVSLCSCEYVFIIISCRFLMLKVDMLSGRRPSIYVCFVQYF